MLCSRNEIQWGTLFPLGVAQASATPERVKGHCGSLVKLNAWRYADTNRTSGSDADSDGLRLIAYFTQGLVAGLWADPRPRVHEEIVFSRLEATDFNLSGDRPRARPAPQSERVTQLLGVSSEENNDTSSCIESIYRKNKEEVKLKIQRMERDIIYTLTFHMGVRGGRARIHEGLKGHK